MKLLHKPVFALYLLTLVWLVLFKFSLDIASVLDQGARSLNLIPFADLARANPSELAYNFLVFIPFGLLLGVNVKRAGFWRKLAWVFYFSLGAEIAQFALAIGATDITDVITNTAGGLLGLGLYGFNGRYIRNEKLDRFAAVAGTLLLVAFTALVFGAQLSHSRNQPAHGKGVYITAAEAAPSQAVLDKSVQLDWPSAGQAAVGTVEDGLLARSSDNEKLRPTASMAKVITALAILEKQPLEAGQAGPTYAITPHDVATYRMYAAKGGSVLPVHQGMELTQYQALQAMLLPSANNIADMMAERVFGSEEAYVAYAQDMLQRMGLSRTVVADASGFSSDTASTPSELVAIGIAALKNPLIAEIVAQQESWIPGVGSIQNTNQLLGADGVVGIKTGTTDEAGSCLLFAADYTAKDGKSGIIVGVVMGDKNAAKLFSDSSRLLDSVKQALGAAGAETVQPAGDAVAPQPGRRDSLMPRQ